MCLTRTFSRSVVGSGWHLRRSARPGPSTSPEATPERALRTPCHGERAEPSWCTPAVCATARESSQLTPSCPSWPRPPPRCPSGMRPFLPQAEQVGLACQEQCWTGVSGAAVPAAFCLTLAGGTPQRPQHFNVYRSCRAGASGHLASAYGRGSREGAGLQTLILAFRLASTCFLIASFITPVPLDSPSWGLGSGLWCRFFLRDLTLLTIYRAPAFPWAFRKTSPQTPGARPGFSWTPPCPLCQIMGLLTPPSPPDTVHLPVPHPRRSSVLF